MNQPETRANAGDEPFPPTQGRLRLPLASIEDVRRELARLYREAKSGRRNVADASRLAHILSVLARLIEGSDLERRIADLEAAAAERVERREAGRGTAVAGTGPGVPQ